MIKRVPVNVSLSPELARFMEERVASGRYQSASEVMREALRLLEERELAREAARQELNAKIAHGLEQAREGKVHDGEAVFDEIKQRSEGRRSRSR